MAVEIPPNGVTIVDVSKPDVGESKPSSVTVEVTVDFKTARPPCARVG